MRFTNLQEVCGVLSSIVPSALLPAGVLACALVLVRSTSPLFTRRDSAGFATLRRSKQRCDMDGDAVKQEDEAVASLPLRCLVGTQTGLVKRM